MDAGMIWDIQVNNARYSAAAKLCDEIEDKTFITERKIVINPDLKILKERYLKDLLNRDFTDEDKLNETKGLLIPGSFDDSVRFSDVDYESVTRNGWALPGHIYRTCDLAVIIARGKYEKMDEVVDLFKKAFNEWIEADYIDANWWHNEINVAATMADIGILAWDALDENQRIKCNNIVARGSLRFNETAPKWSGANQLWGTNISAKHAIIMNDVKYMHEIADRMYVEVAIGMREGIQEDGSYFQHGRRLYAGGYGRNFILSLSQMLGLFDGTPFELPKEKANILSFYILDGARWMIHKGTFDYIACGREPSRPGWGGAGMVAGAALNFSKLKAFDNVKEKLVEFSDAVEAKQVSAQGVKYFPMTALLCMHIDDWYIGYKGINTISTAGEECNEENIYCANLAYGTTTCVMRSGDEYTEMSPVWNFCRIPGTTTRYELPEDLMKHSNDNNHTQEGDRFDGAQLCDCAYTAQTVNHHGISTTVAAFATPWGVAILGSGIKSDVEGEELITTVEQCLATGKVEFDDNIVKHNGIQYINLDKKNKFVTTVEHRKGSWKRNNRPLDDIKSESDVLEITFDRSYNGYAYAIQPETKDGKFEVIVNTEDVQAVRIPDGRIFVHSFADGKYSIDGTDVEIKAHQCLVIDK